MMYAEQQLKKAERLRAKAEAIEGKIGLLRATLALADHPYWEDYRKGLLTFMNNLNNSLLTISDEGDLGVVDRERAKMIAEIRLIGFIVRTPERFQFDLDRLSKELKEAQDGALEIENTYGFIRKGAPNGKR